MLLRTHRWYGCSMLLLSLNFLSPLIFFLFLLLGNVCLTFTEIPYTKPEMPTTLLAIQ